MLLSGGKRSCGPRGAAVGDGVGEGPGVGGKNPPTTTFGMQMISPGRRIESTVKKLISKRASSGTSFWAARKNRLSPS